MRTRAAHKSRLRVEELEARLALDCSGAIFGPPQPSPGVPFLSLQTCSSPKAPALPNFTGFSHSGAALPHAFGAPLIVNQ
jgi:hypothetical protein